MTLVELHVDLERVAGALEKLVFLLEKLVFPPEPDARAIHQATLDDLHTISPEDLERIRQEQDAFAERYRVVPGSEAMTEALASWEIEQRNIYGEEWEPPQDWKTLFARAERPDRGERKPAGTATSASPETAGR